MHQAILDTIPYGVIQVDLSGKIIYVNKSAYSLLGVDLSTNLLETFFSDLNWPQFDFSENPISESDFVLNKTLKHQEIFNNETLGAIISGSKKWFSLSSYPVNDEKGMIGAILTFEDVTEKIQLDTKRFEDSERFKMLIENIDAVVWESSFETETFSYISPKVENLFGYPQESWFEEGFWRSKIYELDKEHVIAYENRKALKTESYQLEYRLINSKGELVWIRDSVKVVKEGNEHVKLRGMMLDVTEQKNSRNLIKESETRFREMINQAPYAITVYDKNGILIAANSKCEEYWMIDLKSSIGFFNIFENELFTKDSQKEAIRRAFAGESGEVITQIHLHHAQVAKDFRIKYYPLFDMNGVLENVIYFTEDITQYVKAEENIKYEESLKQGILNALDQAILVIDKHGKIINVNKKLKLYVRKQPYSVIEVGESIFDFIELLDDEDSLKQGLKSILNQEVKVLDHEMRMADNKWYSIRATPLDQPFGAVITWQNINTRKEIEMALEKSLRKYRNIYNKAPVMMHSINERLEIISVSDFWLEKMGYDRNEVIGKTPADFLSDTSKAHISTNLKKLFSEGFVRNAEYTYRKKNGEEIEVLLSAVAEYDEDGNFERSITGMLDVTELKKTERKLQESQSKLLESQRISKIANYEFDVETGVFYPSEEMISMMGFSEKDKHVSVIEKLIHPEDLSDFSNKLDSCISEGKDFFHIYRIFHLKNNSLKWISGRGKLIKNEKGEVYKMIGTVQDITEQKHAEQKIRKLSDRVLLATEIASLGVWEYDREKDEIFWEDQMYAIFSDADKPIPMQELKKQFVLEDQSIIETSLQMIKSGINFLESEVRIKTSDGEKDLRAFTRVLRDQKGKVKGMVGVVYDISIDKGLQRQLENSLEEKNVLIKEVHHRVKNNMQLISSILALKSYELENEKSKQIFEEVNDRIKAMAVIHDKLYTFYNVSEIDVSEYLENIANELKVLLLSSDFSIEVISEHIIFDVEKVLLIGLIVSEMVGNAVKHGFKNRTDGIVTIRFAEQEEGYLLRVLNNGDKLQPEVINSGTGLGISLIKTFTKQLGGKFDFDQDNGFRVHF